MIDILCTVTFLFYLTQPLHLHCLMASLDELDPSKNEWDDSQMKEWLEKIHLCRSVVESILECDNPQHPTEVELYAQARYMTQVALLPCPCPASMIKKSGRPGNF